MTGDERKTWSWDEFRGLPSEEVTADIHCVTRWSKLDTTWEGVSIDTLLEEVEYEAAYVLAFCDGGYTEMTTATGVCAECGATGPVAEVVVYLQAPGAVGRCRNCGNVLVVIVDRRGVKCVDLRGVAALERAD